MKTYCVSTWDHEADGWSLEFSGLSLWGLRAAIRELLGQGWDLDLSILVEREGGAA